MAPKNPNARVHKSSRLHPGLLIVLILIVGVAALGSLSLLGLSLPFFSPVSAAQSPDRTGKVAVPIAARFIPAHTKVTRDYLLNPETMEFTVVWIDEDRLEASGLVKDASRILNRVLANDKHAAYGFSESDFLPEGTRAGPTAGIEPGMRGLRVDANKVRGMHGLRLGDRFDLIAVRELDENPLLGETSTVVHPRVQAGRNAQEAWNATTRILVQNGKVIEPVDRRRGVGGMRGEVEEVFIGIAEHEVAGLTEALAVGAEIHCLPRTGQPFDEQGLPQPVVPKPPRVIEIHSGDQPPVRVIVPNDDQPSQAMDGAAQEE
jgi:hypothetical protein